MDRLCFGTYARILQTSMQEPNNNQDIAVLLFGLILDNADVRNKNRVPFDLSTPRISELFNSKRDVPGIIASSSTLPKVLQAAKPYFEKKIVAFLNPHNRDDLLPQMTQLITNDNTISEDKKNSLLGKAREGSLSEFLADAFLYAINRSNRQPFKGASAETSDELTPALIDIARLEDMLSKIPRPTALEIPKEVELDEMVYVTELLAAYADALRIVYLPKESLPQYSKYKNDFERRRKDYYAAETIRRGSRDVFGETDPDRFDALKNETYDGIIDVHSRDFTHGFARLNDVMAQAAAIRVDKCLLSRLPDWIGASEKKGVCHILVNDRRIKGWVASDE